MGLISSLTPDSIATAITAILFASVFICAIVGFSRGFMRQTVRAITVIVSAIIACVGTTTLYSKAAAFCEGKTVGEVIDSLGIEVPMAEGYKELVSAVNIDSVEGGIAILFALILLPILFTLGFLIISGLSIIVHKILCAILGFKRSKNNPLTRVLGMALGALQGAVIAAIILFPITNAAAIFSNTADTNGEELGEIGAYVDAVNGHFASSLTMKLGGEAVAKSFAITEIDGQEYDAREEAKLFLDVYSDIKELDGYNYTAPTEDDKLVINGIEDKLFSDACVKDTVSGLLRELALAIDEGRLIINLEDPYKDMLHSAIMIFKDSSSENIEPDMQTILNVYFILADNGVLDAFSVNDEEVRNVLLKDEGEGTVISRVIDELSRNERTKPITTMLAKLTLSIMSESFDVSVDVGETYDTVVDCLTDISQIDPTLPEEEYTEAVADLITDTLATEGIDIELDESIINDMAKFVYDEYRGVEITEDEINDILLSYFEAYANNFT